MQVQLTHARGYSKQLDVVKGDKVILGLPMSRDEVFVLATLQGLQ